MFDYQPLALWDRQFKNWNCWQSHILRARSRPLSTRTFNRLGWSSEYVRKSTHACCSVSVECRPAEKRRRRGEIGSIHRSTGQSTSRGYYATNLYASYPPDFQQMVYCIYTICFCLIHLINERFTSLYNSNWNPVVCWSLQITIKCNKVIDQVIRVLHNTVETRWRYHWLNETTYVFCKLHLSRESEHSFLCIIFQSMHPRLFRDPEVKRNASWNIAEKESERTVLDLSGGLEFNPPL